MSLDRVACATSVLKPGIWTQLPWYLDSATSWSLKNCSRMIFESRRHPETEKIVTADNGEMLITGFGPLKLKFLESYHVWLVNGVAFIPDAGCKLISLESLAKLGNESNVVAGASSHLGLFWISILSVPHIALMLNVYHMKFH